MADWPPSLKPIGKYVAHAANLEQTQPLVAYYCHYYALKRAIELRDTNDERANRLVTGLLEKCESAKNIIGPDDGTHRSIVEEYALSIFDRADKEDREDRATKETALTFLTSAFFLEVCRVFDPLAPPLDQRLAYAKWKAGDISKALREGRRPNPGARGEAETIRANLAKRTAEQQPHHPVHPEPDSDPADSDPADHGPADHDPPAQHAPDRLQRHPSYPDAAPPVPPAPPLREYESDLHEYQPQMHSQEHPQSDYPPDQSQYPSVAPPYPSTDISPLPPNHRLSPPQENGSAAYSHVNSSYPYPNAPYSSHDPPHSTPYSSQPPQNPPTDNSYSAYHTNEPAYPVPSAPYIPTTNPYVPESRDYSAPSGTSAMPAIPSLELPGLGVNMGDPGRYKPSTQSYAAQQSPSHIDEQRPSYDQAPQPALDAYDPSHTHAPPRQQALSHPQKQSSRFELPSRTHTSTQPPSMQQVEAVQPPNSTPYSQKASHHPALPTEIATSAKSQPAKKEAPASNFVPSISATQEAQRLAKYAASALDFQDLKTAVSNLEDALNLLRGTQ